MGHFLTVVDADQRSSPKPGQVAHSTNPLWGSRSFVHPEGRKAVFLGDLVDRGPRVLDTVRLVRNMVVAGSALCVPGNHDMKFMRKLRGKDVQITHGLAQSLAELDALPEDIREPFARSWPSSSTAWSAIMSSTTASWSSPTPA